MANRSYLYSTNVIPGANAMDNGRKLIGISEWDYDTPIVFKLLLSSNPMTCSSSIWEVQEEIALVGDYASGVKNLEAFLSKITVPDAQPLIAEALEFLNNPENKSEYFVLECGEIFEMEDSPLQEQNQKLLQQVKNLQPEIEIALQSLLPPAAKPPKPVGLFAKLLGRVPELPKQEYDPMQSIYLLGLGNWSNILYFDFTNS